MVDAPARVSTVASLTIGGAPVWAPPVSLQTAPRRALQEGQACASEGGLSLEGACVGSRGMPVRILAEVLVETSEGASVHPLPSPVREGFESEWNRSACVDAPSACVDSNDSDVIMNLSIGKDRIIGVFSRGW